MITFILASIYSDVRGAGPLLPPVFATVRASERRSGGMDDERGTLDI